MYLEQKNINNVLLLIKNINQMIYKMIAISEQNILIIINT